MSDTVAETPRAGSPRLQAAAESTRTEAEARAARAHLADLLARKEKALEVFTQAAAEAKKARESGASPEDRLTTELAREAALTASGRATIAYEDAVRAFLAHSVTTGEAT